MTSSQRDFLKTPWTRGLVLGLLGFIQQYARAWHRLLSTASLLVLMGVLTVAVSRAASGDHQPTPSAKTSLRWAVKPLTLDTAAPAPLTTISVTTTANTIAVDGQCSLREAITNANDDAATHVDCPAGSGADTITLQAGATYTLAERDNTEYGFNGLPAIVSAITIEGNGTTITRAAAAALFRLFYIAPAGQLTLRNVVLSNGLAWGGSGGEARCGAGGGGAGLGGAIYNQGTLNLTGSTLTGNAAEGGYRGNWAMSATGAASGGGGLGGYGGSSTHDTEAGSGGGGFGGNGGIGACTGTRSGGGGGGGTNTNGSAGENNMGGAGGELNGGAGGNLYYNATGGGIGGGGGGGSGGAAGGSGGIGGGGGGGGNGRSIAFTSGCGGPGGFGGGGGGSGGGVLCGGSGGFGGGGGGSSGLGGFGAGRGGASDASGSNPGYCGAGGGGAGLGGAIFNHAGTLNISNSTISGNIARGGAAGTSSSGRPAQAGQGLGGGVFTLNGTTVITYVTFNNNIAVQGAGAAPSSVPTPAGGGLYARGEGGTATLILRNSILANSFGGTTDAESSGSTDLVGSHNLIEVALAMPGIVSNADPELGPLQNNGGLTPTHLPFTTSPALDQAGSIGSLMIDQRGIVRPQDRAEVPNGADSDSSDIGAVELGATFNDVPPEHPFYTEISKLAMRGITRGCGGGNFCPDQNITREQLAIFIERALGVFNPPTPQGQTFADVPPSLLGYPFIEDFAARGITQGCAAGPPRLYCPAANVTREQMAIFILRALGVFTPPPGPTTATFADVPNSGATDYGYEFIEEFYRRGITSGCDAGPPRRYCPAAAVRRGQMAVFLVRAFNL